MKWWRSRESSSWMIVERGAVLLVVRVYPLNAEECVADLTDPSEAAEYSLP